MAEAPFPHSIAVLDQFSEAIIQTARTVILVLDTQGCVVRFNPYFEELSGWALSEAQGRSWFDMFLPETDRQTIRRRFQSAVQGDRTVANVNPILTKDGRLIEIEWYDAPLTDGEGKVVGLLCSGQDTSSRREAEKAIRESEFRIRAILNTAADAIITIDGRGIIRSVNSATERMFGYTQQELVGKNVSMLMPKPYCDEHDGYLARYMKTGQAHIIGIGRELVAKRKNGTVFAVDLAVSRVDHLDEFTGIIRDISVRKELQKQVLSIAEGEQRRIGQELHDVTGQELTGLALFAGTLAEWLETKPKPGAEVDSDWRIDRQALEQLRKTAQRLSHGLTEANRHVQQLSHGIMPVRVEPDGLRSALEQLAATTNALHTISCSFDCPKPIAVSNDQVATHLYRIAQEAVSNALRHSQATLVRISLLQIHRDIILEVSDNGVGLNPESLHPSGSGIHRGFGLEIMNYRAQMVGGIFRASRRTQGGTLIRCVVPGESR
jgi:PAS domain S-box-containing protein